MDNYFIVKTAKYLAFIALSIVFTIALGFELDSMAIYFLCLPAVVIPFHYLESKITRIRAQLFEFGVLMLIVVGAALLVKAAGANSVLMTVLSLVILPTLFVFNAHFYRKYKDFSEDKYIYFVVSMLAGFIAILFYAANKPVMALIMLVFSLCQFIQWAYYYRARRQGKDLGLCAFELIIPSAAIMIGHLFGDIKSSVAVCLLLIFPISYYLYKGLIKLITRMHLYSVFIQFLLFVTIGLLVEDKTLEQWIELLMPLLG